MAKIFIDVGGYHGAAVLAALDPLFNFARIYCFEPSPECVDILKNIDDARVVVVRACLHNDFGEVQLYNPGTVAASVYRDAPEYMGKAPPVSALRMDAGYFLSTFLRDTDRAWIKLNCEGSECDILESIIESRESIKIASALVDFDALKIPSQMHRVSGVRRNLDASSINYYTPPDVQFGMINPYGGVRNWLIVSGAAQLNLYRIIGSAVYNAKIFLYRPEYSGYHKMKILKAVPMLASFARSRRRKRAAS